VSVHFPPCFTCCSIKEPIRGEPDRPWHLEIDNSYYNFVRYTTVSASHENVIWGAGMQKMTRLSTIACKHTCQRKAGESSSSYALTSWVALPLVTAAARNCNRNFTSGDRDGDDLASGPVISIIASGGPLDLYTQPMAVAARWKAARAADQELNCTASRSTEIY
jgi:hypothetical protein